MPPGKRRAKLLGKPPKEVWDQLALTMQVGLTFAGSLLFCFALGYWLDKWLGTRGILLTLFILLGLAGGGYQVYRAIAEALPGLEKKSPGSDSEEGREGQGKDGDE